MKKLKIWWLAYMCDYPFFRVIYTDGTRTRALCKNEADGLIGVFSGKITLDYEYANKYLNSYQ